VQECNKVIEKRAELQGFKHKAGASEQGKGEVEIPEKAIKNGKLEGGGDHSFPDVLYMDGDKIVASNSATESAPGRYIGREVRSFNKLLTNVGEYVAKITGKKRPEEDEEEYRSRAREICEEAFDEFLQKELERVQKERQTQEVEPPSP
jgi:hypothetical protein